jgi:hypothetical protein
MLKRFTLLACAFTVLLTSGISAKAAVAGDDDAAPGTLTISIRDLCDPLAFNATAPAGLGAARRSLDSGLNWARKRAPAPGDSTPRAPR